MYAISVLWPNGLKHYFIRRKCSTRGEARQVAKDLKKFYGVGFRVNVWRKTK